MSAGPIGAAIGTDKQGYEGMVTAKWNTMQAATATRDST